MKYSCLRPTLWAASLAGITLAFGQQANPVTPTKETTLVLSPFVIDASTDEGYSSAFSTSGSRLKTNLKDIAASVTVLTEDFMNDLGANDVASALAFVSGAENDSTYHQESIAGLGSSNGYVGGDFGDNNNRSGEVRVRGLGRATTTINYIEALGSTDRYNTDRSEFLRGANSILFGLAEPAGLVNSSTKVARTNKDAVKIDTKIDDLGSTRLVLDVNKVLINGQLALRAVGLHGEQKYKVKSAFQRDERFFLTSTWQPFQKTRVIAFVEEASAYGRRPNNRTVQDNVSDWLKAYNQYAPLMTPAQIASAFYWDPTNQAGNPANGIAGASDNILLSNGQTVNLGIIRREQDTLSSASVLLYSPGQWGRPLDNRMTILANRDVGGALPAGNNTRSIFMRSGSPRENNPAFRSDPQVTDPGIFPYETIEIGALPGNYRDEKIRRYYLTIEQNLAEDLNISATFQQEVRRLDQIFATITQSNQISVDINTKLPDGRANPNFLRPYIFGRSGGEYINEWSRNLLVQANYDFDFAKKTTRLGWLGFHRLTGLYTEQERDRLRYQPMYLIDSTSPAFTGNAAAITANQHWALQQWYVGDPVKVGDTALRFTGFPDRVDNHVNQSYDMLYFNNATKTWQLTPEPVHIGRRITTGQRGYSQQRNDGYGVSMQSFFWDRKIVTLLGWRQDKVDSFQGILKNAANYPYPTIPGPDRNDYESAGLVYKNKRSTSTKSIVYKILPQLRVFANTSENFAATTPRQDSLYRSIAPQSGKTDEVGIGVNLLDGKLDIRAIHFKSSQVLASSQSGVVGLRIPPFEDRIYDALQTAGRLAEWFTVGTTGGTTTDRYTRPNNGFSTEDRVSQGQSLEITFKPNRNWEFAGSIDRIDNVKSNVGREVGEFFDIRAPFYKKFFDQGMRSDGTLGTPYLATDTNLLSNRFILDVANNWIGEILTEGISNPGLSEYTARVVGNYKFTEGRLKGVAIGTNLRWESGKSIGYKEIPYVFNFGGLTNIAGRISDTANPFFDDPAISGGMFIKYGRKIWNGRVNWRMQLNAQNLFSKTGLRVIGANADGSPIWGRNPDRAYELSNSFDF